LLFRLIASVQLSTFFDPHNPRLGEEMKKILIGVGIFVVLLVAAVLVVPSLIPADAIRDRLVAEVNNATGRQLRLEGPISLSVIPSLAVKLEKVALSNAPGGQAKDMVSLSRLDVELKLFPLIGGNVEIDRFVLVDPVIALEVDRQGRPNWQFAGQAAPAQPSGQSAPAEPAKPGGSGGGGPASISLGDVRIVNGTLSYVDLKTGARQEIKDLNLKLSLPSFAGPLTLDGKLGWNGKPISIQLNASSPADITEGKPGNVGFRLDSDAAKASFEGKLAAGASLAADGALTINVPSVKDAAAWAGHKLDLAGKTEFNLAGKLALKDNRANFNDATITFDQIAAKGNLGVGWGGPRPSLTAKLAFGMLDLNPYMPAEQKQADAKPTAGSPAPSQSGTPSAPAQQQGWSREPIDASALKAADADIGLTAEGIKAQGLVIGPSELTIALKNGRLVADLLKVALYEGQAKGRAVLDGSAPALAFEADFDLAGVKAEPLLKDAVKSDRLSGTMATNTKLTSKGQSQFDLVSALNGSGSVKFVDGAIKGINIGAMVRNIGSAFTGGGTEAQKTDFAELSGTYTITNGILKNTDLSLQSPLLRVAGAGSVDLPKRTVDYRITPRAVASAEGQGGKADLAGITVPVIVSGPWDNLSYKPDLAGAMKDGLGDPSKLLQGLGGGAQQGGSTPAKPSLPLNPFRKN
jgi:AsmA protein